MKKTVSFIVSAAMLLSFALPVFAEAEPAPQIRIFIDGGELVLGDNIPMSESFRTLVPMRALFEKLGAEVVWYDETQSVTASIGGKTIDVQIDNSVMSVDGTAVTLDVPPRLIGDYTYLPLRAVTESFGADVQWDEDTQTVTITTVQAAPAASAAPTPSATPENSDSAGNSVVPVNRPVSISDGSDILLSVGNIEITKQEFRSYLVDSNMNIYKEFITDNGISDMDELQEKFSWDAIYADGKTYAQISKERALEDAEDDALSVYLARQNGVTLSSEDNENIKNYVTQVKQSLGDSFDAELANSGFASEDGFAGALERVQLIRNLESDILANRSKYITSDADFAQYADSETVSAKHVLIQFEYTDANGNSASRTDEEALAIANEVKKKADAGTDFNELMDKYNEDPGETAEGYTFGKGEMVAEFENASFALKIGEISEPVKTVYGYHVIKRVAGLTEILNRLRQSVNITADTAALSSIPVELEAESPFGK